MTIKNYVFKCELNVTAESRKEAKELLEDLVCFNPEYGYEEKLKPRDFKQTGIEEPTKKQVKEYLEDNYEEFDPVNNPSDSIIFCKKHAKQYGVKQIGKQIGK